MNRLEWILGIVLVVLLLVVGVFSLTLWFRNDRTAVPNSASAANSATIIAQRADARLHASVIVEQRMSHWSE